MHQRPDPVANLKKGSQKHDLGVTRKNILRLYNGLHCRSKFEQFNQNFKIKGEIGPTRRFPTDLSTESVDSFPLASGRAPMQPPMGIAG